MQAAINRRTNRAPRAMLVVMSALTVVLGACSSGDDSTSTAQAPADTESPAVVAAVPAADQSAQDVARMTDERRLQDQKADVLVKAYLDTAQGYMDAQDFDRAEQSVLQALMLRKDDARAVEMFRKVMGLKGRKLESMEDVVDMVRNRRELARQQQLVMVKQRYVAATHDESNGDFDAARQKLEDAQLVMRYDPYETDFGAMRGDVDELQRLVGRKLEAARKASESEEFSQAYDKIRMQEEEAKRREDSQVRALMVASLESFNRGDYDNAEHQSNKVLRIRPDNQKAKEVVNACRGARHAAWREQFLQARRQEFERWMIDIRDAQIPHTQLLQWADADKWAKINDRARRGDHVDQASEDSAAVAAIRAKLKNDVITLDYGDTPAPFKDVVKSIKARTGINIVVDPDVMTEKGEEPVNVTLRDYNLGESIKILLDNLKLGYVLADEVMKVTTVEKAAGSALPRVYEVRDLTVALPDFKAPDLRLTPGPVGEAAVKRLWGEDLDRVTETDIVRLSDLIRENCGAGTWDREGHSITPSAGQLVISTTPETHKEVTAFLDNLRRFNKLTVHVEARFISVTKAFLLEVGFDFRGAGGQNPGTVALLDDVRNGSPNNASAGLDNGGPGLPAGSSQSPSNGLFYNNDARNDLRGRTENIFDSVLGTTLDSTGGATVGFSVLNSDIKINGLLRAVEKNIDQTLVNAPRLTIYNRQRANLSIVNQVSYVKDYDVEVAQTAFIADPLVDVVQDGLTLDVRPTVSFDRKWVKLDLQPTVATLLRPIRTFETNLSGLTVPVVIELPEVTTRTAQTSVNVPNGGWVVIGGLKHVSTVDVRSSTPILGDIPIIGFLFSRKGRSDEIRDLMIIMHVKIVDLTDEEKNLDR